MLYGCMPALLVPPAPTEAMMSDHAVAAWARRPRAVFWGCLRPVCLVEHVNVKFDPKRLKTRPANT